MSRSAKGCASEEEPQGFWQKFQHSIYAFSGYSIYDVDFTKFRMDITANNASFKNTPGFFSVKLFDGNLLIAERNFSYVASLNTLKLANPAEVQYWVASYDGLADGYDIKLTDIELENASGNYGYTAKAHYDDKELASFSWNGVANNECTGDLECQHTSI